jgi:hypothetical protein
MLGGKNRRVLRDPINCKDSVRTLDHRHSRLTIKCLWKGAKVSSREEGLPVSVHLPIDECVELLKRASLALRTLFHDGPSSVCSMKVIGQKYDNLLSSEISVLDMEP